MDLRSRQQPEEKVSKRKTLVLQHKLKKTKEEKRSNL